MGPIPLIQLPAPKVKGYATISLYVGHSCFDEPPGMAGINHLLEHVLSCNDDVDKEIARQNKAEKARKKREEINEAFYKEQENVQP